jgi:D-sedoheptulose 7-phosphate isomerase
MRFASDRSFAEAHRLLGEFLASPAPRVADGWAQRLASVLRAGNKIMICGNGGSMCDAAHFAEELSGRFRSDRPALAAIACADPAHITCVANDYGFEFVFSRWVEALGRPGDVLIVLSTSGKSPNCLRAAAAAKQHGILVLGLLGKTGGPLLDACDEAIIAPGATSDRIQELHMLVLHTLVEGVEAALGHATG